MGELPKNLNGRDENSAPNVVRSLFEMGTEAPAPVEAKQEMDDPRGEAERIVKRLAAIVDDHRDAAVFLKVKLDSKDLGSVIAALRSHAKGGKGAPVQNARDEIHGYCLNRLFDELVEEPSNILFTTQKGAGTVRYDAMNAKFWIECLDLFEVIYCSE